MGWSDIEVRYSLTYQLPMFIMQIEITERFSTGSSQLAEWSQASMIWDLFGVNFHMLPLKNITFELSFLTQIK